VEKNKKSTPMKNRTLPRKLAYWLIFVTFFTLIPLLLLEGVTRTYLYIKYHKPNKSYGLWQSDKELGAIHALNGYNSNAETNDFGFRNVEAVATEKPAGATRGIVYGGSIVYCYNLMNDEAWPLQLQKNLRDHHNPNDQVLNGGAICWSIGHCFRRAKRDLPVLKPDYVVIYSGINEQMNATTMLTEGKDIHDLIKAGKYGEITTNYDQSRWVKRNVALVRVFDYVINPWLQKIAAKNRQDIGNQPVTTAETAAPKSDSLLMLNYLHVLHDFIQLIKDNGSQPIFVIQSHSRVMPHMNYFTSFSENGAAVAREMGATVLDSKDMGKTYKGNWADLYIASGCHFTKSGAEEMGKFIYQAAFAPKSISEIGHKLK
jgi:lysophospholipase L1-like esterase